MILVPFDRKNSLTNVGSNFGELQNVLDSFFSSPPVSERQLANDTFKIDIEETETSYLIDAELPGIEKEEIDLSIENDNLAITVNIQEDVDNSDKNYIHKERKVQSMSRSVRLVNTHLDAITAKTENGILRITVPKNEQGNSRKISIE